jgi:cell division transport system permease protein
MSATNLIPEGTLLPARVSNARALWVVLIIMALLAGAAMLFARGAMRLSGDWQEQLGSTLTVQVPLSETAQWQDRMETTRGLLLDALPGADVEIIDQAEARALVQPWLGNTELPENLPVPGLLSITLAETRLSVAQIETRLAQGGITANVDDNTRYADGLRATARRLVGIGFGLLALVLSAGLAVNIFATRAGMHAQRDVIRVLVQVGATDRFVARLFVRQAALRGALGALIGLGLAALLWLVLSFTSAEQEMFGLGWNGLLPGLVDLFWLVGLGIVFALICAIAAGITATRQLAAERKRL